MFYLFVFLFLLGRVLLGGYFIMNGYNHFKNLENMSQYAMSKKVPMPKLAVGFTGAMLLLGGVGVIVGYFAPIALMLLAVFLIGVTFQMHQFWKIEDPMQKMGEQINFFKNLGLLGSILILIMFSVYAPGFFEFPLSLYFN